ncbi:MAG: hypothetical protein HKL96_03230 [Phycisphaerales bacterium]|nr:hypothetical protein [Phycisphaerales bacterium]
MTKKENKVAKFECYIPDARVEMWSTQHIPFEPKGEVKQARDCLKAKIKCLDCNGQDTAPNKRVRHAVYWSLDESNNASDVENILTYNIGVWTEVSKEFPILRFERAFRSPPKNSNLPEATHHYSYRIRGEGNDFDHWKLVKPCWNIEVPLNQSVPFKGDYAHYGFWLATSRAIAKKSPPTMPLFTDSNRFALKVRVQLPGGKPVCVKKLLDGVITAMHPYKGVNIDEVAAGIAKVAPLKCLQKEAKQLLSSRTGSPLAPRECFQRYSGAKNGLKMNPGDDRCVAVEISLIRECVEPDCMHVELYAFTDKCPCPLIC